MGLFWLMEKIAVQKVGFIEGTKNVLASSWVLKVNCDVCKEFW